MKLIKLITSFFLILVVVGCSRVQPIMNVENTPVGYNLQKKEVRQAIITAAQARKWVIKDAGNGELTAVLYNRSHSASIRIPYSAKYYSIIYVSSANLNASGNNIHRNYNRWINNLNVDIQQELGKIGITK